MINNLKNAHTWRYWLLFSKSLKARQYKAIVVYCAPVIPLLIVLSKMKPLLQSMSLSPSVR